MECTDRAHSIFAQCHTMHADTISLTPDPNWGRLYFVALTLAAALAAVHAWRFVRRKETP